MTTANLAFINAEQRCFEFFRNNMIDIDGGISGYIGELPISIGNATYQVYEKQMWMFAITGQAETMTSPVGSPVHCHLAQASFRAMVSTRKTALFVLGRIRSLLPVQVAPTVQRMHIEPGMTITRDTVELSNDLDEGGLYRVWLIEQPLTVQFNNDEEELSYEGN